MKRTTPLLIALLATLGAASSGADRSPDAPVSVVSDSARAELEAGRFWHASRLLRAEGALTSTAADALLLARAEAGWNNWPGVRELLRDASWLETESAGVGLYLLGRAEEEAGEWAAAASAFRRYAAVAPDGELRQRAASLRAARASWRSGDRETALSMLEEGGRARSWMALELARVASDDGDVEAVEALLPLVRDAAAGRAGWRLLADARLEADDLDGAAEAFAALRESQRGERRAIASVELGRLLLAAGDTLEARALLLDGLEDAPFDGQTRAAAPLLDLGDTDRELTLRLARIMDRSGDGRRALRGYDRVVALSTAEGVEAPIWMRIERARLMGTVRNRQQAAIEEFRAIREARPEPNLAARSLDLWARLRSRQGLSAQVNTLRRWLLEEYPASAQAAEVVYDRASRAESRGQLDAALEQYGFVAENARAHARAGQGRMRSGQIHLGRSNREAAVEVFEGYLEDFPAGRRWQEATYWAARVRWELGDSVEASAHVGRLFERDPVSYYTVMGADLLGVPYVLDVPVAEPVPAPAWLVAGLGRLDLYTEAGLESGAAHEIDRLTERARGDRDAMLGLAEGLIERGRTIDGINLGWELRADDHEWDSRLIRVAFPFPYRELVRREAAEWGLDPITMAAIIRQESAFKADIVSHAGAIGLMQVMPPTGAQLARAHGPDGFHEANLTAPEVNLHLGAAFFVEMSERYDDDLPLVLSAYNAGPARANRWRRYPEASDPLRFTERIPFVETRGYVKNVRRNLGVYRVLYGDTSVGRD